LPLALWPLSVPPCLSRLPRGSSQRILPLSAVQGHSAFPVPYSTWRQTSTALNQTPLNLKIVYVLWTVCIFSSARSSCLFVPLSLSKPGPSYPLSSWFCFSCPASSPSGTSSPIQGSHPLFLPSSVPCSSSRPEQGVYPLCTSAEVRLPTSAISFSVQAPPTEVPYQTVVSPSRPLLPHDVPPSEPSPLEDHFSPLHPPAMVSPIRVDRLELELLGHPDQAKVAYVISGLRNGFHLGFHSSSISLKSATSNMPSALLQPSIIDSYIQNELHKGRIAGPFPIGEWSTTDANSALQLPPIYLECCRDHGHLFGSQFSHWGRPHSRSTGSPGSSY